MKQLFKILVAVLVLAPGVAFAGDAPILRVYGWGIGSMSGRLMLYLGDGNYCVTSIRLGFRWLALYGFVFATIAIAWLYGRRHRREPD